MRQIVLDTETTGLSYEQGDRIIEIGAIELVNRRLTHNRFHQYINPQCEVNAAALAVHGLSNQFLNDKPTFSEVYEDFIAFIKGAELIIHNAPFDMGFINYELQLLSTPLGQLEDFCQIVDTLVMARQMHPGQKNSLDALCKRYSIDNSQRDLHGALLDAEILGQVYLAMTGGQVSLFGDDHNESIVFKKTVERRSQISNRAKISVIKATEEELELHKTFMSLIKKTQSENK